MKKYSKELKAINKALTNYYKKHGGNCAITCSVFGFDENTEVVDDMFWIVGYNPCLKVDNEEMGKLIDSGDVPEYWEF